MPAPNVPSVWDEEGAEDAAPVSQDKRWVLARDVLVFQGKLALDALRDLVLSPVSIGVALIGIFTRRDDPGHYFYNLMRWGRRSDQFINLFSAGQSPEEKENFPSVDDLVSSLEEVIVKEHEKGGMTAEAKATIDKTMDMLEEQLARDSTRASTHIKAATDTVKREIKKVRDQVRGPDEPPAPPGV